MKKVLITGCADPNFFSHRDKIGKIGEYNGENHSGKLCWVQFEDKSLMVPKVDCHFIQPTWEVWKEWEEGGKKQFVEYWRADERQWKDAKVSNGAFFDNEIYRLRPEPPKPRIIPLDKEGMADLVGKVLIKKDNKSRLLVIGSDYDNGTVLVNNFWHNALSLSEEFENPDGITYESQI